jgi:hypothetical protein
MLRMIVSRLLILQPFLGRLGRSMYNITTGAKPKPEGDADVEKNVSDDT